MSIYDDQFNEDPQKPPKRPLAGEPSPRQPPLGSPSPYQPVAAQPASPPPKPPLEATLAGTSEDEPAAPRRRGCGCGSCFLAFFVAGLICVVLCGVGGFVAYQKAPTWAHDAIVAAVNDSELKPEDKAAIEVELDRLLVEYEAGNISNEQLAEGAKELFESPVMVLIMVYAAMESYVEPSGLSEDEKADAKLAFQRVARGVFDESIEPDDLERALDYISTEDFNGNRQMKSRVSDEDLRSLVQECESVADEAEVPNEPYEVDVVSEVRRIVDRALGVNPEDDETHEEPEEDSNGEALPAEAPASPATPTPPAAAAPPVAPQDAAATSSDA